MRLRWIAGLSVVCSLALAAPASGANRPVYFVHGWALSANADCAMWSTMTKAFNAWGLKGSANLAAVKTGQVRFHTVGYYYRDKGCNTVIDVSGDHAKVPGPPQTAPGVQPHMLGSHTANTPIEHLAYHLAWNIYTAYSVRRKPVDVVVHSMGGLIVRYAIAASAQGVKDFPPPLLVEDVVTLGTPHGGSRAFTGPGMQVGQMRPGSSFLKTMEKGAFNPQGAGGTDWTTVGSDDDDAVAADRAVGTDRDRNPRNKYFGSRHKVWYTTANNLEHSDYYKESTTTKADAPAWVALAGKAFLSQQVKVVHPIRLSFLALRSANS